MIEPSPASNLHQSDGHTVYHLSYNLDLYLVDLSQEEHSNLIRKNKISSFISNFIESLNRIEKECFCLPSFSEESAGVKFFYKKILFNVYIKPEHGNIGLFDLSASAHTYLGKCVQNEYFYSLFWAHFDEINHEWSHKEIYIGKILKDIFKLKGRMVIYDKVDYRKKGNLVDNNERALTKIRLNSK